MKKNKIIIVMCMLMVAFLMVSTLGNTETFTIKVAAKRFMDPTPTYMKRVDINFDTNKLRLSPAYKYYEVMNIFENNWTKPDGAHYHSGGNVYFAYCPSSSLCEYEETEHINEHEEYHMTVLGDRYHWVEFEVEADCDGEVCEYDFLDTEDENGYIKNIDIYVNGTKVPNAKITEYNEYWHLIRVWIPFDTYNGVVVKSIEVTSDSNYVQRGTTSTFTANVGYYGDGGDAITWSVTGNKSSNTKISNSGVLTVDSDEESDYIRVRATSNVDNTVYDEKGINLIDVPLSIDDVTIREESQTVVYGGAYTFYAKANGTASEAVIWTLTGANKAGTTISDDGTLTVAADETAKSVVITATSIFDNTKKASLTVTLRATEYIHRIEISYDIDAAVFSTKTTYGDVRRILERDWLPPENAGYGKGNNNVWFGVCASLERCELNELVSITSSDNMTKAYTYVSFEVFAKPYGDNEKNPLYDFEDVVDANDYIENIEVWVNGVKRDDAIVYDYNETYRMVHVYVPVSVTSDKLAQYFDFYYNEYPATYGESPFRNDIREYYHIGDGEISYESSNPSVATVDSEGYVTVKKVGSSVITVSATETDEYKAYSNTYTVVVKPKPIYPTITGYTGTYHYTGSQITPEVTVTYDDTPLVKDVDYAVTYGENINKGYAYIYVNPVEGSNYTFYERSEWVWIYPADIKAEDITLNSPFVVYDGTPKEISVTVVVDGKTLVKDTDYVLSFSNNTAVGTGYVRIEGIGNYNGINSVPFEIVECMPGDMNKNNKIDLADIILLLKRYLNDDATDEEKTIGDMDNDGSISLKDIIMLLKEYLKG